MLVAGIWVVLLGTCLTIVAAVALVMRWHSLWLVHRLRTTPRTSCSGLIAARRLPRRILISGATAPGPEGLLTSPGYRIPCLWYRFAVNEMEGSVVPGDPFSYATPTIVRHVQDGPIALDDGTGSVLLAVDIAVNHVSGRGIIGQMLDDAGLSQRHRAVPGSPMANLEAGGLLPGRAYGQVLRKSVQLREDVIRAGRTVTVLGRPRRTQGDVILARGVLSAADPDGWIAILEAGTRSSKALLRFFPIGIAVGAVGVTLILIGLR